MLEIKSEFTFLNAFISFHLSDTSGAFSILDDTDKTLSSLISE